MAPTASDASTPVPYTPATPDSPVHQSLRLTSTSRLKECSLQQVSFVSPLFCALLQLGRQRVESTCNCLPKSLARSPANPWPLSIAPSPACRAATEPLDYAKSAPLRFQHLQVRRDRRLRQREEGRPSRIRMPRRRPDAPRFHVVSGVGKSGKCFGPVGSSAIEYRPYRSVVNIRISNSLEIRERAGNKLPACFWYIIRPD